MKLYKRIYNSSLDGKISLIARVWKDACDRYHFETSLNGQEFELNNNMPVFRSESEAYEWIEKQAGWKRIE